MAESLAASIEGKNRGPGPAKPDAAPYHHTARYPKGSEQLLYNEINVGPASYATHEQTAGTFVGRLWPTPIGRWHPSERHRRSRSELLAEGSWHPSVR